MSGSTGPSASSTVIPGSPRLEPRISSSTVLAWLISTALRYSPCTTGAHRSARSLTASRRQRIARRSGPEPEPDSFLSEEPDRDRVGVERDGDHPAATQDSVRSSTMARRQPSVVRRSTWSGPAPS